MTLRKSFLILFSLVVGWLAAWPERRAVAQIELEPPARSAAQRVMSLQPPGSRRAEELLPPAAGSATVSILELPPPRQPHSPLVPQIQTQTLPQRFGNDEAAAQRSPSDVRAPDPIDGESVGMQTIPFAPRVPSDSPTSHSLISQGAIPSACIAPAAMSGLGIRPVPFSPEHFSPTPVPAVPYDPGQELAVYRGKYAVPVQRPWVEFWRPFYGPGIYPPASDLFGKTNLLFPHFYVYGDYRTAVGVNRNQAGDARTWAHRLNLDMDLRLTATERIHGFMGPLDKNNQFTRLDFTDDVRLETVTDARFETLFFEGDAGAITGGLSGTDSPFDLPFTFGLIPLLYQNGIWMEDAMLGAAVAIPARNSPALRWSNYEATFFVAGDQITSDAFQGSNSAAEAIGTAWFIEAYDGYIELDYAYVHDDVAQQRSYNNFAVAYTRRYWSRLSNSVRFISNFGQRLPAEQRTADGYLLLLENSLISFAPNTFVPYCNLFYGSGRPQSVARAVGAGGILRNTGINFESDLLTGYPTLDATGANTYGAALGLNMLGANFRDQLVIEAAALGSYGDVFRRVPGDQYAAGVRYQRPLSYRCLIRTDAMYGFLRNAEDIVGSRVELRWKF